MVTTPEIRYIVKALIPEAKVFSLTNGSQNPHHIDIKPSQIVLAQKAKLIVAIGLGYEEWLEKLNRAKRPVFSLGPLMSPEKGDLAFDPAHPNGNPHLFLDPVRVAEVSMPLAERLSELFPKQAEEIKARALAFQKSLLAKHLVWQKKLMGLKGVRVATYHSTFYYFLKRYGIENKAVLENHPGQPPSPERLSQFLRTIEQENVKFFLVEKAQATKNPLSLSQRARATMVTLPSALESEPDTLESLIEAIVQGLLKAG